MILGDVKGIAGVTVLMCRNVRAAVTGVAGLLNINITQCNTKFSPRAACQAPNKKMKKKRKKRYKENKKKQYKRKKHKR